MNTSLSHRERIVAGRERRPFHSHLTTVWRLSRETIGGWSKHNDLRLGASVAYYTVFAITPLFLIALTIAGFWFGQEAATQQLFGQISGMVGKEGGEAIQALVTSANKHAGGWVTAGALLTLFVGSTGVFIELQNALNTIWQVRRKPGSGLRHFIKARLLSFAMVLALGFLLLVSLIISAALAALGKFMSGFMPAEEALWQVINFLLSLGMVTVLYALIFKYLPDVKIAWRDVWLGALIASVLFNVGKFALGYYLGRSSASSVFGAAGSLVIILLWVYYSSQTLFLGAEFTRVNAQRAGRKLTPARDAEFITVNERRVEPPTPRKSTAR